MTTCVLVVGNSEFTPRTEDVVLNPTIGLTERRGSPFAPLRVALPALGDGVSKDELKIGGNWPVMGSPPDVQKPRDAGAPARQTPTGPSPLFSADRMEPPAVHNGRQGSQHATEAEPAKLRRTAAPPAVEHRRDALVDLLREARLSGPQIRALTQGEIDIPLLQRLAKTLTAATSEQTVRLRAYVETTVRRMQATGQPTIAANALWADFAVERSLVEEIKESARRGDRSVLLDLMAFEALEGKRPWLEVEKAIADFEAEVTADPLAANNWLEKAVQGAAGMLPGMVRGIVEGKKTGAIAGAGTGAMTALILGQAGPQVALPEEVLTVPAAAMMGYTVGSAAGAAEFWRKIGTGSMYRDLKRRAINDQTAARCAAIAGVPYALVEMSQVGKLLPGADDALRGIVTKSLLRSLTRLAVQHAGEIGQEALEEGIQGAIAQTTEEVALYVEGQLGKDAVSPAAKRVLSRFVEEFKGSIGPMAVLAGPKAVGKSIGLARTAHSNADLKAQPTLPSAVPTTSNVGIGRDAELDAAAEPSLAKASAGTSALAALRQALAGTLPADRLETLANAVDPAHLEVLPLDVRLEDVAPDAQALPAALAKLLVERKRRAVAMDLLGVLPEAKDFGSRLQARNARVMDRDDGLALLYRLNLGAQDFQVFIDESRGRLVIREPPPEPLHELTQTVDRARNEELLAGMLGGTASVRTRGEVAQRVAAVMPTKALELLQQLDLSVWLVANAEELNQVTPKYAQLFGPALTRHQQDFLAQQNGKNLGLYFPVSRETVITAGTGFPPPGVATTVAHELAHALDYLFGDEGKPFSGSAAWVALFNKTEEMQGSLQFPTRYSSTHPREFFAECSAMFLDRFVAQGPTADVVLSRQHLRSVNPEAYALMEELFLRRLPVMTPAKISALEIAAAATEEDLKNNRDEAFVVVGGATDAGRLRQHNNYLAADAFSLAQLAMLTHRDTDRQRALAAAAKAMSAAEQDPATVQRLSEVCHDLEASARAGASP